MVSGKTTKRKTLMIFGIIGCFLIVAFSVFGILFVVNHGWQSDEPPVPDEPDAPVEPVEPKPEPEPVKPDLIDFQPVVDEWASSVSGNRSVIVYDLERDEMVGSYNTEEDYNTASLYKLFVVYEGYRRLQNGEWHADDAAGATGNTIIECLDLAIRESYSPCAETLWNYIGHVELDNIITNDFGITNSDISHLVSNPNDILRIMKLFYAHPDIADETLIARMKDSFLNQPPTTYNWRQGLPSGFSDSVNVYNKVGWDYNPDGGYWNIYHDAAIVEFPKANRHFVVIVMTNRVPFQKIRDFGSMIEEKLKG